MRADALRAVSGRPVLATPVMSQAETMAMQNQQATRYMQPQAATTMQRPVAGGMPPRQSERRSSSWVMAVLAGLGVLVVVVLGVALAMSRNNNKGGDNNQQTVTVLMPNLKGKTENEALTLLSAQQLTNHSADKPTTGEDCNGTVVKQDPAPNAKIPTTQPVTYTLCMAPAQVPVPNNLVGSTKANAEATLKGLGLNPQFKEVSNDQPAGTVVSVQHAGEKVDPGTNILVTISKANQLKMPKVTGESLDAALAVLENAGPFTVVQQTTPADDPSKVGTVVQQNPKAGAKVEKGDTVTITIATDASDPSGDPSPTDTSPPGGGGGGAGQAINQSLAIIRPED